MKTEAAKAANQIKSILKNNGIKCSAKSKVFSMGSSVDVKVKNLLPATLEKVKAFCEQYEYGTFDGMTDCQGIKNRHLDLPQAKYVSVSCDYDEEYYQAAWEELKSDFGLKDAPESYKDGINNLNYQDAFWRTFRDSSSKFWTQFKPRIAA